MFASCPLFSFGTVCCPGGAAAQQQYCGEKQGKYASIHRVSSFQGNQGSLRPVTVLSPCRDRRRTACSSKPKDAAEPVESHGLDVTAQVPVVQPIAVIQLPSGTAHQRQAMVYRMLVSLQLFYHNKENGLKSLLRMGI